MSTANVCLILNTEYKDMLIWTPRNPKSLKCIKWNDQTCIIEGTDDILLDAVFITVELKMKINVTFIVPFYAPFPTIIKEDEKLDLHEVAIRWVFKNSDTNGGTMTWLDLFQHPHSITGVNNKCSKFAKKTIDRYKINTYNCIIRGLLPSVTCDVVWIYKEPVATLDWMWQLASEANDILFNSLYSFDQLNTVQLINLLALMFLPSEYGLDRNEFRIINDILHDPKSPQDYLVCTFHLYHTLINSNKLSIDFKKYGDLFLLQYQCQKLLGFPTGVDGGICFEKSNMALLHKKNNWNKSIPVCLKKIDEIKITNWTYSFENLNVCVDEEWLMLNYAIPIIPLTSIGRSIPPISSIKNKCIQDVDCFYLITHQGWEFQFENWVKKLSNGVKYDIMPLNGQWVVRCGNIIEIL
jgi:hypothetical protein